MLSLPLEVIVWGFLPFILLSLVYYTDRFSYAASAGIPDINPTRLWCFNLETNFWIMFVGILFSEIHPYFSF